MNYLAHLVLSGNDSDVLLGNFIGDAIKGRDYVGYPPRVAHGIRLHRQIDSFADHHPIALKARAQLRPMLGRFSAVGVDLLYDYFLSRNFQSITGQGSIELFARRAEASLQPRMAEMPTRSQRFFEAMVEHDWLVGYGSEMGMMEVCRAMDHRLTKRFGVETPLKHLFEAARLAGYADMKADFASFWKDIESHCHDQRLSPDTLEFVVQN